MKFFLLMKIRQITVRTQAYTHTHTVRALHTAACTYIHRRIIGELAHCRRLAWSGVWRMKQKRPPLGFFSGLER